ncbi:hypothetical protein [Bacillus sp. 03113]|nr:hypothetical protein [Bacillus sp. 03113]
MEKIVSYLPDWEIFIQGLIVLFVPLAISRFFNWFRTFEEE